MNSYTNVFGGENVNPADLSYKFYHLTANIELEWSFEALDGALVVADKIDVQADAGFTVAMPDAKLVSVGEDVLWNNIGAAAFTVIDYAGAVIVTIQPGTQWYTYLVDNATQAGTWRTTQFGAGTSVANAAALAGMGMRANVNQLDQNLLTDLPRATGNQTLTAADRAKVFRHTGGAATHSFNLASSLGPSPMDSNGWFVVEINAGSGNLVLTPTAPDLIDGNASKTLGPNESCVVYCFGNGFATMGYGRAISTSVSGISIDGAAGSGDIVMSPAQLASQVQDFTGTLTANRTIVYGDVTGYWFIYNHTVNSGTNTFNLAFKGGASDSTLVSVPQGNFSILRSQGGQLDIALTAGLGSVTSIATVPGEISGGDPTPITLTGTLGLADMPTGPGNLTPGTYGTPIAVPKFRVDAKGRVANVVDTAISILAVQIADLVAIIPPGTMFPYAGITMIDPSTNPYWLPCDGTIRLRADFVNLFATIGTTFNTGGELATQFRLPDTRGRVLAGVDDGAGRLTATYFGSAVLGAAGGAQSGAATTAWGGTTLNNINFGNVGFVLQAASVGAASGGVNYSPGAGFLNFVQINDPVSVVGYTPINANFNITVSGTNTSSAFANVQPTLIIRHIIKT